MKKILYGLIGVMVVTGVIGLIYSFTIPQVPETEYIADDDAMYPSELRPVDEDDSDTNVTIDPDVLLEQDEADQEELITDELTPDENFTEFEIEEEENQEEVIPEEAEKQEKPEDVAAAEAEGAHPEQESAAAGIKFIININKVNIRKAPDSNSTILAVLRRGDIGDVVEAGPEWSILKLNEKQGYVYNSFWDVYTPPAE